MGENWKYHHLLCPISWTRTQSHGHTPRPGGWEMQEVWEGQGLHPLLSLSPPGLGVVWALLPVPAFDLPVLPPGRGCCRLCGHFRPEGTLGSLTTGRK